MAIVRALLGPTNTGKTHRAIERLLEHESGMIGLPLRLLAREVYDRITRRIGESRVALVTGEEKRVPVRPRYWICTVEAMPENVEVDFLAVDEIQLAAHPERGHVFTDRLLRARGVRETWFMGADTMRPMVERLLPVATIQRHPRLSKLSGVGSVPMSALPPRSAVVAFSAARVYEIAERIRARRGGAAVVLGALSPRARNAQVALYQSGEVDYMVATDAIGMGLNLDVDLVAFADLRKFDGHDTRALEPAELAQIAGRAGRHHNNGSFATLGPLPPLSDAVQHAIESHSFTAERRLFWRNADLDKSSIFALIGSLQQNPKLPFLRLVPRADDLRALVSLAAMPEIEQRARGTEAVSLLWNVCQIPDFRKLMLDDHAKLVAEIFLQLAGPRGRIDEAWLSERIQRIDDVNGDIDTLLFRMAFIRTWTYVAHHTSWLSSAESWQERTRDVEDRLSDALHERLVQRFVDGSKPGRRSYPKRSRRAGEKQEEIAKEGPFSKLAQLRLPAAKTDPSPMMDDAAFEELADAPHDRFQLDGSGRISESGRPIAQMTRGVDVLRPEVALILKEQVGAGIKMRLLRRLLAWTRDLVEKLLSPLREANIESYSAAGRGLLYQLEHGLGTVRADAAKEQIDALSSEDRENLERLGIHLGSAVVYLPPLLKPGAVQQRTALRSVFDRSRLSPPRPGAVSIPTRHDVGAEAYASIGYPVFGPRAIRADVAERVYRHVAAERDQDRDVFGDRRIASWLGCPSSQVSTILGALFEAQPSLVDAADDARSGRKLGRLGQSR